MKSKPMKVRHIKPRQMFSHEDIMFDTLTYFFVFIVLIIIYNLTFDLTWLKFIGFLLLLLWCVVRYIKIFKAEKKRKVAV